MLNAKAITISIAHHNFHHKACLTGFLNFISSNSTMELPVFIIISNLYIYIL